MKQKYDGKEYAQKRKKQKTFKEANEKSEILKAEVLDAKNIREGMLLLGCVTEIRSDHFLMSLPGCLVGKVPATNISQRYTDMMRHIMEEDNDDESEDADLHSVVEQGAVFPCRVMGIVQREDRKKRSITLSINPQDIYHELRMSSLYIKMVLYSAVVSVEDHGYVMEVGLKGIQGFLPFKASDKRFRIGQVIPVSVCKLPSKKNGNVVWLSELSFNETFPEIENDAMNLISIIPGVNVAAYITEIRQPFIYLKCMDFDACASMMSLGSSKQKLTEATRVSATVLYVHPITHMIYLSLRPKPTPDSFSEFFQVKKFELLKNIKFQYSWNYRLLFKIHKGSLGYVMKGEVYENRALKEKSFIQNPVISKARVLFLHYMDNLVQLAFSESLINLDIKTLEDIQIGDTFEATVRTHLKDGMFVHICPGLTGYIRRIHAADVLVTMLEKLHPIQSKVKCRILSKHPRSGLSLTCKESLLALSQSELLTSYESAQNGQFYKGVIVNKADTHILVLFFNDVKGVVPAKNIPPSSIFFVGQTVTCQVIFCDPSREKLNLSLLGDNHGQSSNKQSQMSKKSKTGIKPSTLKVFEPHKLHKAVVQKVSARQLSILVDGVMKGRIHVTELGQCAENCFPLKEFAVKQCLKVNVLGLFDRKSWNYLPIGHRNRKQFLECSLEYPPTVPLNREFRSGMGPITGYVKKINVTSVEIWLSPVQFGTLDYLDFSDNATPKELRKLKKHFKVGRSISVHVLEARKKPRGTGRRSNIKLTKLEHKLLKVGQNVIGLVEVATLQQGLALKLPSGYSGTVSLTDLQDTFVPVQPLLTKCQMSRFILCHILDVNHTTKKCIMSLRKSRLYRKQIKNITHNITPEFNIENIEKGKRVSCYIKQIADDHIIVNFGRMLDGKVAVHKCQSYGCTVCKFTQNLLQKYVPGNVIEVVIDGKNPEKKLYPLSLPRLSDLAIAQQSRLSMTEDIDWNEL